MRENAHLSEASKTRNKLEEQNMTECGGKTTRKINEITATPSQEPAMEITLNAKPSGREQDPPKKGKHIKKKELKALFGTGDRVPPPSTKGTLIDTVINQRKQRNDVRKLIQQC
jgi:hypothetical protein